MNKFFYWVKTNKTKSVLAGILLLLILSNPGEARFKSFVGDKTTDELSKKYYLLFCSIYNDKYSNLYYETNKTYIAFLGNFILLNEEYHSKYDQ